MKVINLLGILKDLNPEMEVKLLIQPSYPLEYGIKGTVLQSEVETGYTAPNEDDVVFLVTDNQIGYGSRKVFDYC